MINLLNVCTTKKKKTIIFSNIYKTGHFQIMFSKLNGNVSKILLEHIFIWDIPIKLKDNSAIFHYIGLNLAFLCQFIEVFFMIN